MQYNAEYLVAMHTHIAPVTELASVGHMIRIKVCTGLHSDLMWPQPGLVTWVGTVSLSTTSKCNSYK